MTKTCAERFESLLNFRALWYCSDVKSIINIIDSPRGGRGYTPVVPANRHNTRAVSNSHRASRDLPPRCSARAVLSSVVACSGAPLASSPGTRCRTPYNACPASILPYGHYGSELVERGCVALTPCCPPSQLTSVCTPAAPTSTRVLTVYSTVKGTEYRRIAAETAAEKMDLFSWTRHRPKGCEARPHSYFFRPHSKRPDGVIIPATQCLMALQSI